MVLSRGHYHWRHEPAWYAVRSGATGHWSGDRTQTTLWTITNHDQDASTVHGTQKPVDCMRRSILNTTSPGQAVYDPFLGSGTTVIAAETNGRSCYGLELDPAYVDVIVTHWAAFTGEVAVLEQSGQELMGRYMAELGLTPAARSRIVVESANAASERLQVQVARFSVDPEEETLAIEDRSKAGTFDF